MKRLLARIKFNLISLTPSMEHELAMPKVCKQLLVINRIGIEPVGIEIISKNNLRKACSLNSNTCIREYMHEVYAQSI